MQQIMTAIDPQKRIVKAHIELAIAQFGTERALADAAGISQPSINRAKHRGIVGHEVAAAIDRATGGKVQKSTLRPDIWPPEKERANG